MVYIIAEAGVNHDGSIEQAYKMVEVAADIGADAIKFQTFKTDNLVVRNAEKAQYQKDSTGIDETQYEMLKGLELSFESFRELARYSNNFDIDFLSTAFDSESLEFLVENIEVCRLKIPSGEITNAPFLIQHAWTGKDIIISTGMCDLCDIETALGAIAYGLLNKNDHPDGRDNFLHAYYSEAGRRALKEKVTLLHCTSEYPTPSNEMNIRVIDSLRSCFGLDIGLSDHSNGINAALCAVSRGATMIEKHFTLDKNLKGPDHSSSLDPTELQSMISSIKEINVMLGDGVKRPTQSELKNRVSTRKSVVAAKYILKGELLTEDKLTVKRPGNGLSPIHFWDLIGTSANQNYEKDSLIVS